MKLTIELTTDDLLLCNRDKAPCDVGLRDFKRPMDDFRRASEIYFTDRRGHRHTLKHQDGVERDQEDREVSEPVALAAYGPVFHRWEIHPTDGAGGWSLFGRPCSGEKSVCIRELDSYKEAVDFAFKLGAAVCDPLPAPGPAGLQHVMPPEVDADEVMSSVATALYVMTVERINATAEALQRVVPGRKYVARELLERLIATLQTRI